jgi:hypothetical protein
VRRPGALGLVIALFLLGVAVGALSLHLIAHDRLRLGDLAGPGNPTAAAAELHRRLDLDSDQQRQLDAILADSHREAVALWREMRPRLAAVVDRADNRIIQILRPEQRQEFERYRRDRSHHLHQLLRHLHGVSHGAAGSEAPPHPVPASGN